jgi:hypothetical protein
MSDHRPFIPQQPNGPPVRSVPEFDLPQVHKGRSTATAFQDRQHPATGELHGMARKRSNVAQTLRPSFPLSTLGSKESSK